MTISPLLRRQEVERVVGLSCPSIYRLMRAKRFPEPIRIGPRAVRWRSADIQEWIDARPRATGDGPRA